MTSLKRLPVPILCSLAATAVVLTALPSPLPAQGLLEEIIVTAQRREQLLQDVPVAVTAYNAEQLERLQVTQTLDIAKLVPNFIGQNNTGLGTANVYSIRGLNNTESIATFDPPVGTYIDDIYVARQNANNFQLFDTERVEVLRGPQGTLFGRNTTGGAVRVILRKPSEEAGGFLEAGYGSYDRYQMRGTIDVPVTNELLTKFSAYWIDDDGWMRNLTTGERLNGQESWGVRGALRWLATDALTWDLAMDYIDDKRANQVYLIEDGSRVTRSALSQSGTPFAGLITGRKQGFAQGNQVESFSIYSTVDWDIADIGTVSFITGWRDMRQKFALDFLPIPSPPTGGFSIANDGKHEQFTQEIKLDGRFNDSISYVAGFFYMNEDNRTDFADLLFGGVLADRIMENETDTWAVYAQADVDLTDRWTVTAGLRYTDEEKEIAFRDNRPGGPLTSANMVAAGIPLKITQKLVTPRLAVQYTVSDDLNFYASATRGFKSGGWNARGLSPEFLLPFGSEIVWSYEGGMRWDVSPDLRLNITAFFTDVSDFQLPSAFEGEPPEGQESGPIVFITQNFADLRVKGVEFELLATPTENLTLLAVVGVQNGKYRKLDQSVRDAQAACLDGDTTFCGQGIVSLNGDIAPPVRLPDYTLTLGANYLFQVTPDIAVIPGAYLYALGNHNITTNGVTEAGVSGLLDGYTTFNASVALEHSRQDWRLTVECRNCNDRVMPTSILANQIYYQDPRTWNIRFRKDFRL